MSSSTPNLDQLSSGQAGKEVRINELTDALSPGALFGRQASTTTGLTWGYYGGAILVDGVPTVIANGTVTLTNTTNYVEVSRAGTVSVATSRSADKVHLYTVVASGGIVSSYTDERNIFALRRLFYGRPSAIAMADANVTLTQAQAICDSLEFTGTNTALRDCIVPAVKRRWTVFANTVTNGVRVIAASGTGITIAVGKTADVEFDGTNVRRLTADV